MNASESVRVIGTSIDGNEVSNSNLSVQSNSTATGDAGKLRINTKQLLVQDGAGVSAATTGEGDGGSLSINASDFVELTKSGFLVTQTDGSGDAGEMTITTDKLLVSDGAEVSASTLGGESGSIKVNANTLEITNGGGVFTSTGAGEKAGDITLKVVDNVILAGENSGLFANTFTGSTGDGGSIFIDPRTVIIRDGARVAVNSQGQGKGGDIDIFSESLTLDRAEISADTASTEKTGGDINIFSGSLTLDNKSTISAITESTDGGNITLQIDDDPLLLRSNSLISATAGNAQAGGDGGNITINAPFIIAFPNEDSDITANAFEGNGGNIDITTNAIFGIEFRDEPTLLSDFTVSSELGIDGNFALDDSGIDPTRGLIILPEEPVNTQISPDFSRHL